MFSLSFSPLVYAQEAEAPSSAADLRSEARASRHASSTLDEQSAEENAIEMMAPIADASTTLETLATEITESAPLSEVRLEQKKSQQRQPKSTRADTNLFWNGETKDLGSGMKQTTITGGWVNYLNEETQTWQPIDTTIVETTDGFEMHEALFEAHFPLRSTSVATMHNNNQYDIWGKERITEPAMDMAIAALDVNDVPGVLVTGDLVGPSSLRINTTYVLYEGAYPDGDLIYYIDEGVAPRLGKLIRFNHEPAIKDYSFTIRYSEPQDFTAKDKDKSEKHWNKNQKFTVGKGEKLHVKNQALISVASE